MKKQAELERDYTDNVGHPPQRKFEDGEGAEQWDYTGTPKEKQRLLKDLGVEADRDPKQETLF